MRLPRGHGDGGAAAVVVCVRKGECGGASDQWRGRGHAVGGRRERERKRGREGRRERERDEHRMSQWLVQLHELS